MAKKSKDDVPNPNSITNRDILQRLNFLYQASQLLGTQSVPPSVAQGPVPDSLRGRERKREMQRRFKERHSTAYADLSRTYVKNMKAIGRKTNMRMDPAVKRTLCKGCDLVLVPGLTAEVRVNSSTNSGHTVSQTCMSCRKSRRIPAPPIIDENTESAPDRAPSPPAPAETEASSSHTIVVDTQDPPAPAPTRIPRRSRPRRRPAPRLPPLFERNVGHVIFRGNERIA
ncbi:uncharacterized protein PHACADRAFT_123918 [Phanerochaete carnosa HHB-10118-sp]|uniref:Rpr2-domain-containing protein n=1 Tax=Phanerochaete carnosa (strain HHB-10118-sp) TaxID=650164 RepID=K5WVZ7_PHACS|nr:uncharacterized protein PHACADRAFT_123918 [Phanerochaete carnosa HHB-10118-sp]EKM54637.1 hypothetical protein PHACADRAFT_123918 [Phanerochaete carnosa HHB-10118-sp]